MANPLFGLLKRFLIEYEDQFVIEIEDDISTGEDFFEVSSQDKKMKILANSPISATISLNWCL